MMRKLPVRRTTTLLACILLRTSVQQRGFVNAREKERGATTRHSALRLYNLSFTSHCQWLPVAAPHHRCCNRRCPHRSFRRFVDYRFLFLLTPSTRSPSRTPTCRGLFLVSGPQRKKALATVFAGFAFKNNNTGQVKSKEQSGRLHRCWERGR